MEPVKESPKAKELIVSQEPFAKEAEKMAIPSAIKTIKESKLSSVHLEKTPLWSTFAPRPKEESLTTALTTLGISPSISQKVRPNNELNKEFLNFCKADKYGVIEKFSREGYLDFVKQGVDLQTLKQLSEDEKYRLTKEFFNHKLWKELAAVFELDLGFELPDLGYYPDERVQLLETGSEKFFNLILKQFVEPLSFLANVKLDHVGIDTYKRLVENGYSITFRMIDICFDIKNYRFLEYIFSKLDLISLKENHLYFLEKLKESEDPNINRFFSNALKANKISDYGNYVSEELFTNAVLEGRTEFVKWALENGKKTGKIEEHLKNALETYNIPIIKALFDYGRKEGILKQKNYLEILGFGKPNEKDKDLLFDYAINSPISDIREIAEVFPHLKELLPEIFQKAALVVRFPVYLQRAIDRKTHSTLGFGKTTSVENHNQSSREYASKNLQRVKSIAAKLPDLDHKKLLKEIVEARKEDFGLTDELYSTIKKGEVWAYTKLFGVSPNPRLETYWHSLRHFSEIAFDSKETSALKQFSSLELIEGIGSFVNFNYTDEAGNVVDNVNGLLNFREWKHPTGEQIAKFEKTLEDLHKELIKIDPKKDREFFDMKMARYYYLIATLSEYERGTPHNAMMALNVFYAYHNLPPPIPKMEHFFLDNTALMLPIEAFISRWNSFFENTSIEMDQMEEISV